MHNPCLVVSLAFCTVRCCNQAAKKKKARNPRAESESRRDRLFAARPRISPKARRPRMISSGQESFGGGCCMACPEKEKRSAVRAAPETPAKGRKEQPWPTPHTGRAKAASLHGPCGPGWRFFGKQS